MKKVIHFKDIRSIRTTKIQFDSRSMTRVVISGLISQHLQQLTTRHQSYPTIVPVQTGSGVCCVIVGCRRKREGAGSRIPGRESRTTAVKEEMRSEGEGGKPLVPESEWESEWMTNSFRYRTQILSQGRKTPGT